MMEWNQSTKRIPATPAIQAFSVWSPISRSGTFFDDPLRDVQHGRDGTHHGFRVLAHLHLAIVSDGGNMNGRSRSEIHIVTVDAHADVRFPAPLRHRFVFGRAPFAEALTALTAVVFWCRRCKWSFAFVTMLENKRN